MGKLTELKLRLWKLVAMHIFNQSSVDSQISRDAILLANDIKHKLKEESDGQEQAKRR